MTKPPSGNYQIASDTRLAQLTQQGDLYAYEHLVRRHQHRLICFLNFYNPDRRIVEDVAGDIFIQCYRQMDRIERKGNFRTGLYAIACDFLPRLAASRPATVPVPSPGISTERGPGQRPVTDEHPESIWPTVRAMTNGEEFRLLWFRFGDRLSLENIATISGAPVADCKLKLWRLRIRLWPQLRHAFDQPPTAARTVSPRNEAA